MDNNIALKEIKIFRVLLEYQALTVTQLAYLCSPSKQMARKKIRELARNGLVEKMQRDFNSTPGRAENIIILASKGMKILGELGEKMPAESLGKDIKTDAHNTEHRLLINWIRIHLDYMEKHHEDLRVNFLSFRDFRDNYIIDISNSNLGSSLIPDGIFSINHTQQKKSLLFFLEVDMGTETLSSREPYGKDIRKKILSYQHIFKKGLYKRLEEPLNGRFKGFRALFIVNTKQRYVQICRLVRSMRMAAFIWVTDKDLVFKNGISDNVWSKGGDDKDDRFSILGENTAFTYQLNLPE